MLLYSYIFYTRHLYDNVLCTNLLNLFVLYTLLFIHFTTGSQRKTDVSLYFYNFFIITDHFISVLIASLVQSNDTLHFALLPIATPARRPVKLVTNIRRSSSLSKQMIEHMMATHVVK